MPNGHWQPTARFAVLQQRALVLRQIRQFFSDRGVLEVETPLYCAAGNPEPNIAQFRVEQGYLQTSPEFAMKRLLAAGSGCIYQIAKAFRDDEAGQNHNKEFTLLEWYRVNLDYHQLMEEVQQLLQSLQPHLEVDKKTYSQAFQAVLGIDPLSVGEETLFSALDTHISLTKETRRTLTRDLALELLFSHKIETTFNRAKLTFICDFPTSQAALAEVTDGSQPVAKRFELYWKGLELANGFQELRDSAQQRQRFEKQNQQRLAMGLEKIPLDEAFLSALEHGLPSCSGVALGIDRLLMAVLEQSSIAEVMSFSSNNA